MVFLNLLDYHLYMTNKNYSEIFSLELGGSYQFPDFVLEYVENYQDTPPEDFPNKESGLFRGKKFKVKSQESEIEFKVSDGSGLLDNAKFSIDQSNYLLKPYVKEGTIEYSVEKA